MPWTRSSLRAGLSTHRSTNFANICCCEYPRPTEGGSDGGREAAPRKQDCPQWAEQPVLWGHLWSPAPQPRRGPHENTYLGQLNWRLDTWQVTMKGRFINRLFSSWQATLCGHMKSWKASGLGLTCSPRALSLVASLLPHLLGRSLLPVIYAIKSCLSRWSWRPYSHVSPWTVLYTQTHPPVYLQNHKHHKVPT